MSRAYTNDADGNTLTGGGRTNTWDSKNRLVKCVNGANTSTFTYGSDGIRHSSVVNGVSTDFVLDNSMFVRELHNGNVKATYFMGASGPAYKREDANDGTVRWYLYDGLGSVLGEVDPNGNITARRKYDVYGMTRAGSDVGTSKHKFVGQLGHPSEDETGLVYMRSRYYEPAVGRFVSEDPSSAGINWYIYCVNDPVNKTDATGRDSRIAILSQKFVEMLIALGSSAAWGTGMAWGLFATILALCAAYGGDNEAEKWAFKVVLTMPAIVMACLSAVSFAVALGSDSAGEILAGLGAVVTCIVSIVIGVAQGGKAIEALAGAIGGALLTTIVTYDLAVVGGLIGCEM